MNKKINITSTALEKGIDLAKDFLDKLIMPTMEEAGLLMKDKITLWRFKNQIKMLGRAKTLCEELNINPKTISLKLLCPLLEYSSIEEESVLQEKWAILLLNMVDSEQNIDNHVFPYILSQISLPEFEIIENVYQIKLDRIAQLNQEIFEYQSNLPNQLNLLNEQIHALEKKIRIIKSNKNEIYGRDIINLYSQKRHLDTKKMHLERKGSLLNQRLNEPQNIPEGELEEFEISNLVRLGLIKYIQTPYANSQTLEIPYESEPEYTGRTRYTNIDLDVEIEYEDMYIMTELGELFIKACRIKKN